MGIISDLLSPNLIHSRLQTIADDIHEATVSKKSGGPSGNQNCLLCTWAVELNLRDIKMLPRAVYSPRDIIFTLNGEDIVQNPTRLKFNSVTELFRQIAEIGDSRFYAHVNWRGRTSGHEFNIVSIDGKTYIVDGQVGYVRDIKSRESREYFDINFKNSYIVRTDNKSINRKLLKYNKDSYITYWDDELDMKYMKEHDML